MANFPFHFCPNMTNSYFTNVGLCISKNVLVIAFEIRFCQNEVVVDQILEINSF